MEAPLSIRVGPSTFGLGVFAVEPIKSQTVIGYYMGETLDKVAYYARYGDGVTGTGNVYILRGARGGTENLLAIDARDAALSSWARYINSPYRTEKRSNVHWGRHMYGAAGGGPRVEIRASRNIAVGDELLIAYGRDYPW